MPFVGQWRLTDRIGAGGVGEVWSAQGPSGKAAVKLVRIHSATSRARFEREADALLRLQHPNVVRAFEHGRIEGSLLFLAMELLNGETLHQRLRGGPISPVETVQIAQQVAAGLAAAHAAGLVHRDVKPGNIFLCDDGVVKVLDFGVAHILHARGEDALRVTAVGDILGTVAYMSPEQATGRTDIDERTDVWGLGATVYHALVGYSPFAEVSPSPDRDRASTESVVTLVDPFVETKAPNRFVAHERDLPILELVRILTASPRAFPDRIPLPLQAACLRALEKEPARRYPDMTSFSEALGAREIDIEAPTAQLPVPAQRVDEVRLISVVLADGIREPDAFVDAICHFGGMATTLRDGRGIGIFGGTEWLGDEPMRASRAAEVALPYVLRAGVGTNKAVWKALGSESVSGAAVTSALLALASARPGEVFVDQETRRLHREVREVGGVEVPMVGRDAELLRLQQLCEEVSRARQARALLVVGAPGIGKSRLRHEFRRWLDPEDQVKVFEAHCESHRMGSPLAAVISALRAPGVMDLCAGETRALLGELLGEPISGKDPLAQMRGHPEVLRDRIRLAVGDFFDDLTSGNTVILIIEDAHWADSLSRDYVTYLLARLAKRPLFVLATARPELPQTSMVGFERIELRELSTRDTATIVERVLGRKDAALVERAGGNPYFAEELSLAVRGGTQELPLTVEGAARARLDQLDVSERELLKCASIFGRRFHVDGARALDSSDVLQRLFSLRRRDLVVPQGDGEWSFRHAILHEVARGLLPETQARDLHLRAADWLASRPLIPPEEVAEHYEAAMEPDLAQPFWIAATELADTRGESRKVIDFSERALGTLLVGPAAQNLRQLRLEALFHRDPGAAVAEAEQLVSDPDVSVELRAQALRLIAEAFSRAARYAEAEARLREAKRLCEPWPDLGARICTSLMTTLTRGGNLKGALDLVPEARKLEAACRTKHAQSVLGIGLGYLAHVSGDNEGALREWTRCEALAHEAGDVRREVRAAGNVGHLFFLLGSYERARAKLERTIEQARRLEALGPEMYGLHNLGLTLHRLGETARGLSVEKEALVLASRTDDLSLAASIRCYLSLINVESGVVQEGLAWADQAMQIEPLGEWEPMARTMRALALCALGSSSTALDECTKALALRDRASVMREFELDLLLCQYDVLRVLGHKREAEGPLCEAHGILVNQLARIRDPYYRDTFSRNVPAHARLLQLWARRQGQS